MRQQYRPAYVRCGRRIKPNGHRFVGQCRCQHDIAVARTVRDRHRWLRWSRRFDRRRIALSGWQQTGRLQQLPLVNASTTRARLLHLQQRGLPDLIWLHRRGCRGRRRAPRNVQRNTLSGIDDRSFGFWYPLNPPMSRAVASSKLGSPKTACVSRRHAPRPRSLAHQLAIHRLATRQRHQHFTLCHHCDIHQHPRHPALHLLTVREGQIPLRR